MLAGSGALCAPTPRGDDIISVVVVVVTLHYAASQGDCARAESNLLPLLLPFPSASEAAGGRGVGDVVEDGRSGEKCACVVERLRGRVLGEGIRSIVLPPCPRLLSDSSKVQTWREQHKN